MAPIGFVLGEADRLDPFSAPGHRAHNAQRVAACRKDQHKIVAIDEDLDIAGQDAALEQHEIRIREGAAVLDPVVTSGGKDHRWSLPPNPARQEVVPRPADQRIVLVATIKRVIARTALQNVIAAAAEEPVEPVSAAQGSLPLLPRDAVVAGAPVDELRTAGSDQLVVAAASVR